MSYYNIQNKPDSNKINFNHPLAKGITALWKVNSQGGGSIHDLMNQHSLPLQVNAEIKDSPIGMSLCSTSTNSGARLTSTISSVKPSTEVSIVYVGMNKGVPTSSSDILAMSYTNGNFPPYVTYGIAYSGSSVLRFYWNNGSFQSVVGSYNISNKAYIAVAVLKPNYAALYVNGILDNSTTSNIGTISYANSQIFAHCPPSYASAANPNSLMSMGIFYNRALTDSEIKELSIDPYCVLRNSKPVALNTTSVTEFVYSGDITFNVNIASTSIYEEIWDYNGDLDLVFNVLSTTSLEGTFVYASDLSFTVTPSSNDVFDVVYSGDLDITLVPASTASHQDEFVYTGTISFSVTPGSNMSYEEVWSYSSNLDVTITPSSTTSFTEIWEYSGDLSFSVTPTSTDVFEIVYSGALDFSLVPNSTTSLGNVYSYASDLDLVFTIDSTTIFQSANEFVYVGDLSVNFNIFSDINVDNVYVGTTSFSLTPSSTTTYEQIWNYLSDLQLSFTPASATELTVEAFTYSGDLNINFNILSGVNVDSVYTGDLDLTFTILSTTSTTGTSSSLDKVKILQTITKDTIGMKTIAKDTIGMSSRVTTHSVGINTKIY